MNSFSALDIPSSLHQNLHRLGLHVPTTIQNKAIPAILKGKDILASSHTGTGKTAAYGIPLGAHLSLKADYQGIILLPTRELAIQVANTLSQIIHCKDKKISSVLLIGGNSIKRQLSQLKQKVSFIVGTPGRINDLLERGALKLNNINYFVLDEVDRMLDIGFAKELNVIAKHMPKQRQTLMFSATISKAVQKLSNEYLQNPIQIFIGQQYVPIPKIKQRLIRIDKNAKFQKLRDELNQRQDSAIIFVNTKKLSDELSRQLIKIKISALPLHGDLKQNKRSYTIDKFRKQKFRILVATDVAARGLDIEHINLVVNYDIAIRAEDHIHRIGRTGRAGNHGEAINFLSPHDENKWTKIKKLIEGKKSHPTQSNISSYKRKRPLHRKITFKKRSLCQ